MHLSNNDTRPEIDSPDGRIDGARRWATGVRWIQFKWTVTVGVLAAMLGSTAIASPAGASPPAPARPSLSTVAGALASAGAFAGHAGNWSPSSSAAVVATNKGLTVSLPRQANGQIVLSSNGQSIGLGIPDSQNASAAQGVGNATTVYTGGAPDMAVAAQADTTGAREVVTITGDAAPSTYDFPISLPTGASLVANPDGSYSIIKSLGTGVTEQLGTIAAPWAKDANGNSVPTSYSVQGDTLVQTVDFTSSTAFPVVVDPSVSYGWLIYVHYTHSEVGSALWQGAIWGSAGFATAACSTLSVGWLTVSCAALFEGSAGYFSSLFSTAYSRGGGIVLEYSYGGWYVGCEYVGNNWT